MAEVTIVGGSGGCGCCNSSGHSSGDSCGHSEGGQSYWSDKGYDATPRTSISTPFGYITGIHHTGGNGRGGTHHTVFADDGTRISWDTDRSGETIGDSIHAQSGGKKK